MEREGQERDREGRAGGRYYIMQHNAMVYKHTLLYIFAVAVVIAHPN